MKFYIVDHDNELKTQTGDWTQNFDRAEQYTFKDARTLCEFNNDATKGDIKCFWAMIPASASLEKKKPVEDEKDKKYYLREMEGRINQYWRAQGEGYAADEAQAYKYSFIEAKSIVKRHEKSPTPVHMEPADE